MRLTLAAAEALAARAHAGQLDKIGVPYIEHVRSVAAGLAPFGTGLQMAGLLHDTVEDCELTARDLLDAGVPAAVVEIVERVTNQPGIPYAEKVRSISLNYAACLVKIADNAHNSLPERTARLDHEKRARLAEKYAKARAVLWAAVPREDVEAILAIVNPALLPELDSQTR